ERGPPQRRAAAMKRRSLVRALDASLDGELCALGERSADQLLGLIGGEQRRGGPVLVPQHDRSPAIGGAGRGPPLEAQARHRGPLLHRAAAEVSAQRIDGLLGAVEVPPRDVDSHAASTILIAWARMRGPSTVSTDSG